MRALPSPHRRRLNLSTRPKPEAASTVGSRVLLAGSAAPLWIVVGREAGRTVAVALSEKDPGLRIARTKAKRLRAGDEIVVTVSRVMGMQGRKPKNAAPLMRIEFEDGSTEVVREDQNVRVLRSN